MAKLSAWLITIIGILLVWGQITALPQLSTMASGWLIALLVLVLGISKLMRNYKK